MRVRGRVETVLDWANARGYRDSDNPARWKGHLANLLPKRDKLRAVKHHPAPALNAAATVSLPSHSSPVQLVERPRIESTRTSSSCSRAAASGYRAFQRSRPASASALRAAFPRNRWFADSAPEGGGFEPSVPQSGHSRLGRLICCSREFPRCRLFRLSGAEVLRRNSGRI